MILEKLLPDVQLHSTDAAVVAGFYFMSEIIQMKRVAFGLSMTAVIFIGAISVLLMAARITLTVLRRRSAPNTKRKK